MVDYIAEVDEKQNVSAVWVKTDKARSAKVFDPHKHIFDGDAVAGYFGAPREKIVSWIKSL